MKLPNKLIPLSDYVLEQYQKVSPNIGYLELGNVLFDIVNYTKFLKQPLKLEYFVPCDNDENVLDEPKKENYTEQELSNSDLGYDWHDYQKALEKVLFKPDSVEENIIDKRLIYIKIGNNNLIYAKHRNEWYITGLSNFYIIEDLAHLGLELKNNDQ